MKARKSAITRRAGKVQFFEFYAVYKELSPARKLCIRRLMRAMVDVPTFLTPAKRSMVRGLLKSGDMESVKRLLGPAKIPTRRAQWAAKGSAQS